MKLTFEGTYHEYKYKGRYKYKGTYTECKEIADECCSLSSGAPATPLHMRALPAETTTVGPRWDPEEKKMKWDVKEIYPIDRWSKAKLRPQVAEDGTVTRVRVVTPGPILWRTADGEGKRLAPTPQGTHRMHATFVDFCCLRSSASPPCFPCFLLAGH